MCGELAIGINSKSTAYVKRSAYLRVDGRVVERHCHFLQGELRPFGSRNGIVVVGPILHSGPWMDRQKAIHRQEGKRRPMARRSSNQRMRKLIGGHGFQYARQ